MKLPPLYLAAQACREAQRAFFSSRSSLDLAFMRVADLELRQALRETRLDGTDLALVDLATVCREMLDLQAQWRTARQTARYSPRRTLSSTEQAKLIEAADTLQSRCKKAETQVDRALAAFLQPRLIP